MFVHIVTDDNRDEINAESEATTRTMTGLAWRKVIGAMESGFVQYSTGSQQRMASDLVADLQVACDEQPDETQELALAMGWDAALSVDQATHLSRILRIVNVRAA